MVSYIKDGNGVYDDSLSIVSSITPGYKKEGSGLFDDDELERNHGPSSADVF
jgi:hypothetical protein